MNCNYTAFLINPLLAVLNEKNRLPTLVELASAVYYDGKSSIDASIGVVDRMTQHKLSSPILTFVQYNHFSTCDDQCMIEASQIMLTKFFRNKKNLWNGAGNRLNPNRYTPEQFLQLAIVRFVMNCVKLVESITHCLELNREVTASDLPKYSNKLPKKKMDRLSELLTKHPEKQEKVQVCIF